MNNSVKQVLLAQGLAKTYGQGATAVEVLKSVCWSESFAMIYDAKRY